MQYVRYESAALATGDKIHALIALGANLPFQGGDPALTLTTALNTFSDEGLEIIRTSRFFATPCFPAGAGPDYVNAAAEVAVKAGRNAADILAALHRIEARFGRLRARRWGMRTLDLDLLALGDTVLPDAGEQTRWRDLPPDAQAREMPGQLILPHPRLQDRAFVLVPLADIAADWHHPVLGLSVAQMLATLPDADRAAVVPM